MDRDAKWHLESDNNERTYLKKIDNWKAT